MISDRKGDKASRICDECGDVKEGVSYWNLVRKDKHLCYSCSNSKTNLGRTPWNKGAKRIPKNIGNMYTSSDGYPMVWVGRHNYSHGYMPLHRLLVCDKENRLLTQEEKVHHIDGDKGNYSIDNLYLCESMSHHRSVHAQLETISFELVKSGLIEFNHSEGVYKLSLPIKKLIDEKSGELLERPKEDNQQPSSEEILEKVQRLFRKEVHSSEWKRRTPEKDEDIVPSDK